MFEIHFAGIRNYVFYRSGDTEIATDIAQETFLKIWEKQDVIQPEKVKGLLYKIAGDLFITHYRKEKRSAGFLKNFVLDDINPSPDEVLAFEQLKGKYQEALEDMPVKQRTVFLMSRMENLKYSEIAQNLELSVKAVEKRMNMALKHLRNYLTQE